jgi:alcohol dehydrogenase (NADP+)
MDLVLNRLTIRGSLISGMKETQEMLDFCEQHHIVSDIELIDASAETIKLAYDRILKGDVKYRVVLDMRNAFEA